MVTLPIPLFLLFVYLLPGYALVLWLLYVGMSLWFHWRDEREARRQPVYDPEVDPLIQKIRQWHHERTHKAKS